jgi:uncharacterized protein YyaL (SSP411 family)
VIPLQRKLYYIFSFFALIVIIILIIFSQRKGKVNSMEIQNKAHKNRLVHEKSPYLLQHANNPVDWFPWGEEAFEKAKKENKPILLSIGYSACHWCHVMAHESFENDSIAQLMNQLFVNIKVDREEFPDVDHLYQTFVQISTGRGGWPLTVFLTPDKLPFFGGTYFPAKARYGMVSFPELLNKIHDVYKNEPQKISDSITEIQKYIRAINQPTASENLPDAGKSIEDLYRQLKGSYDDEYGGFSRAPKFPHVADMKFLLQYYHYTGEKEARDMVLLTLRKMANGGIFDQIGGGFHRYSTDNKWLVPHFEKMLYDNALLIPVYADAYRLTGDVFFQKIAMETAEFVLNELRDETGAFYATLDADSEGEEGKYYVWHYEELKKILDPDLWQLFCEYYDITVKGNFEGVNILNIKRPLESLLENYKYDLNTAKLELEKNRQVVFKERRKRVRPGLDDKIIADWNGMMISALWHVYQISQKEKYRQAAEKALSYIQNNMMGKDNRLYHFIKNDQDKILGYLDDYAYFVQSLIDGFETTQNSQYLTLAIKLADLALQKLWDSEEGGFYFADKDANTTILPLREHFDASTPAGNNIMCLNLLRLHNYTGASDYLIKAEQIFKLLKQEIENRASGLPSLLHALSFYHFSPVEITVSTPDNIFPENVFQKIFETFLPNKILLHLPASYSAKIINRSLIENRISKDKTALFICHRGTCTLPLYQKRQIPEALLDFSLNIQ